MRIASLRSLLRTSIALTCVASQVRAYAQPSGAAKLEIVPQLGHSQEVRCAIFSPDQEFVLTGSNDGTAKLWQARSGTLVRTLAGHQDAVLCVGFSPDSREAVTASADHTAKLWNLSTGQSELLDGNVGTSASPHDSHEGDVMVARFSHDGSLILTASTDNTCKLWNAKSRALIHTLKGHQSFVFSAAFSRDDRTVLSASGYSTAKLWDTETGRLLLTFQGHKDAVLAASFSPDGSRIVTASLDKTAKVWNARTGALVCTLSGHTAGVRDACFSADGTKVATASDDHEAKLWSASSGKLLSTLKGHSDDVTIVRFSPDGSRVLTASADGTARVWNTTTGSLVGSPFAAHKGAIYAAMFAAGGEHVLTGSYDRTAKIWNVKDGTVIADCKGSARGVLSVTFTQDGAKLVTSNGSIDAGGGGTAKVWDLKQGILLSTMKGHGGELNSAIFSKNGATVLTSSEDKTARLWDTASGELLRTFAGHTGAVNSAEFSPNENQIVTSSDDRTAMVWDTNSGTSTGNPKQPLLGHEGDVNAASFSPDGKLVLTESDDRTACIWDPQTGKCLRTLAGHGSDVTSASFFDQGRRVLTSGQERPAMIWDAESGLLLRTLSGGASVSSAAASPDSRLVVTVNDNRNVKVWGEETGLLLHNLSGHRDRVVQAVFSPDGKRILTVSWDHTAKLWDAYTGSLLYTLTGHNGHVVSGAFSPSGDLIATAAADGTTKLWESRTGQELCSLIAFDDGSWAVVRRNGAYDSSNGGEVEGLHWVMGLDSIPLSSFKARYFEKGLLSRLAGYSDLRPLNPPPLASVRLYPQVSVQYDAKRKTAAVVAQDRGGGIGQIRVWLNHNLVLEDSSPKVSRGACSISVSVATPARSRYLEPPALGNLIQASAYDKSNILASPRVSYAIKPSPNGRGTAAHFYALVVGCDYPGTTNKLNYAAEDAASVAAALNTAAREMGATYSSVQITALIRGQKPGNQQQPTKQNILAALKRIAASSESTDVVVLYFSGHGTNIVNGTPGYYYLTADLNGQDPADDPYANQYSLSADELFNALKDLASNHVGLILDTCFSGNIADLLARTPGIGQAGEIALDRLRESKGFYILPGCGKNASSYESDSIDHGLLTYALLQPLYEKSPAVLLEGGSLIDVKKWFEAASEGVCRLGGELGFQDVTKPLPLCFTAQAQDTFPVGKDDDNLVKTIDLPFPKPMVQFLGALQESLEDPLNLSRAMQRALSDPQSSPCVLASGSYDDSKAIGLQIIYKERSSGISVEVRLKTFKGPSGENPDGSWETIRHEELDIPSEADAATYLRNHIGSALQEVWREMNPRKQTP